MSYWQVAAGSGQRGYSNFFLRYGLAFVGGSKQGAAIQKVTIGDKIALKFGRRYIQAAGIVVQRNGKSHTGSGDKDWLHDFDGWDLPSYCCVDWAEQPSPVAIAGLTRNTIEAVHQANIQAEIDRIIIQYNLVRWTGAPSYRTCV